MTEMPRPAWHACAKHGGRSIGGWRPAPTRVRRCGRLGVCGPRRRRPRRCGPCRAALGRRRTATTRRAACARPCRTASTGFGSPRPICAVGANRAADRTGTATLTLRGGRWRLVFTEPGRSVRTGTNAGTALRTAWATTTGAHATQAYVSIPAVQGDGGASHSTSGRPPTWPRHSARPPGRLATHGGGSDDEDRGVRGPRRAWSRSPDAGPRRSPRWPPRQRAFRQGQRAHRLRALRRRREQRPAAARRHLPLPGRPPALYASSTRAQRGAFALVLVTQRGSASRSNAAVPQVVIDLVRRSTRTAPTCCTWLAPHGLHRSKPKPAAPRFPRVLAPLGGHAELRAIRTAPWCAGWTLERRPGSDTAARVDLMAGPRPWRRAEGHRALGDRSAAMGRGAALGA